MFVFDHNCQNWAHDTWTDATHMTSRRHITVGKDETFACNPGRFKQGFLHQHIRIPAWDLTYMYTVVCVYQHIPAWDLRHMHIVVCVHRHIPAWDFLAREQRDVLHTKSVTQPFDRQLLIILRHFSRYILVSTHARMHTQSVMSDNKSVA
jgi:hypothetical protein